MHISTDVYRFNTQYGKKYLVDIEVYHNNFYFMKFYLRSHKNLEGRYKMLSGDNEPLRIFNTCVSIASHIFKNDPLASFGFIGVDSFNEESVSNTKRYRIYKRIATTYFPLEKFNHQKDDDNSLYLLLNRKNAHLTPELVKSKMKELYNFS